MGIRRYLQDKIRKQKVNPVVGIERSPQNRREPVIDHYQVKSFVSNPKNQTPTNEAYVNSMTVVAQQHQTSREALSRHKRQVLNNASKPRVSHANSLSARRSVISSKDDAIKRSIDRRIKESEQRQGQAIR